MYIVTNTAFSLTMPENQIKLSSLDFTLIYFRMLIILLLVALVSSELKPMVELENELTSISPKIIQKGKIIQIIYFNPDYSR